MHVYGVDNVLVRVADPTVIGFARAVGADCVNKVVLKEEPHERVGVMAMRDGKPHVVEYSEIPPQLAELRDDAGQLVYSAGNIAQHVFTLPFLTLAATSPPPLPRRTQGHPLHLADNRPDVYPRSTQRAEAGDVHLRRVRVGQGRAGGGGGEGGRSSVG